MRRITSRARLGLVAVLTLALVAAAGGAGLAFEPSVAIGTVAGQDASSGTLADPVTDNVVTVTGTAQTTPPLIADAGASAFVLQGTAARLVGRAAYGADPYTFAWSHEGSGARFSAPDAFETDFDTTGLSGPVTLTLRVTDADGTTASDTVKLFVYTTTTTRVLDQAGTAGPGALGTGTVIRHPFPVQPGADEVDALDVVLSWGTSYKTPAVTLAGFNLRVEDPGGTDVSGGQGAEFTEPEDVHLSGPLAAGTWKAVVDPYLAAPDSYRVTADLTTRPANPLPTLATDGPWNFAAGEQQVLKATATGGTAPLSTVWDLDFDGYYETADRAGGVTVALPKGVHFVAAKTTDAAGYEAIEINTVRVDQPSRGPVVVAVTDTGINPYHLDFRASTFPDPDLLARTNGFTKHPSTYIPGYPADATAKYLTLTDPTDPAGTRPAPFATGKLYPAQDEALWTKAATPNGKLFWFPGTKIIGAVDASDTAPVNGNADTTPLLDDDGHGTASASVAVGNLYGYCPSCLLFFAEGFAGDAIGYAYPWVDLASNSFGSLANVGFAGLADPSHPKEAAERGQIALYAAGNGNANAFESPEQTYTAENLGADWIVRVGAVDKRYRKPIVGTGKPVDISSWGQGSASGPNSLPAADNTSPNGATTHSGTSAATPYSTGIFGTVLGAVREALGDPDAGQKNLATGDGVIARGTPVPASPYLADGVLTRAELTEVVFKTAEHDQGPWSPNYPVTSPKDNPYQYMVEGYGILEPASADRAIDVLVNGAPLPSRPAEDDFFAADSAIRDFLWGGWNGGGANSGSASQASAAPTVPGGDDRLRLDALTGRDLGGLTSWSAAYDALDAVGGPFQDPSLRLAAEAQAGGDLTYYLHHLGGCTSGAVPGAFMDRTNSAGDDDGCGSIGTRGLLGTVPAETWETPPAAAAPALISAGSTVAGAIYVSTDHPNDSLTTVALTADGTPVGSADGELVTLGAGEFFVGDGYVALPFQLTTTADIAPGAILELSLSMDGTASYYFGYEGDHASFFTIVGTGGGGGGGGAGGLAAAITTPAPGTVVDPALTPSMGVGGTYSFPAGGATALRAYPFWPENAAGNCGTTVLTVTKPAGDSACAKTFQGLAPLWSLINGAPLVGPTANFYTETYPLEATALPLTLSSAAPVSGVIALEASAPDPAHRVTVRLIGTTGGQSVVVGSQTVQYGPMVGFFGLDVVKEAAPFSFDVPAALDGAVFDDLTLVVVTESGTLAYMERDGQSFVDLPVPADAGAGVVQVTVDDAGFANPTEAVLGTDGTWGASIDATRLADGPHTVSARAVLDGAASTPSTVTFTVQRATTPAPPVLVQVQLVGPGQALSPDAWVDAADLTGTGSYASWRADLALGGTAGTYQVHARLLQHGEVTALDGPVTFTVPPATDGGSGGGGDVPPGCKAKKDHPKGKIKPDKGGKGRCP